MSYFKHHVFFCTNQRNGEACCQDHDAQSARDYTKAKVKQLGLAGAGRVRINNAGCLDRCAEGPCLVVYPEGTWYTYREHSDLDEIVEEHLKHGRKVQRLMLADQ